MFRMLWRYPVSWNVKSSVFLYEAVSRILPRPSIWPWLGNHRLILILISLLLWRRCRVVIVCSSFASYIWMVVITLLLLSFVCVKEVEGSRHRCRKLYCALLRCTWIYLDQLRYLIVVCIGNYIIMRSLPLSLHCQRSLGVKSIRPLGIVFTDSLTKPFKRVLPQSTTKISRVTQVLIEYSLVRYVHIESCRSCRIELREVQVSHRCEDTFDLHTIALKCENLSDRLVNRHLKLAVPCVLLGTFVPGVHLLCSRWLLVQLLLYFEYLEFCQYVFGLAFSVLGMLIEKIETQFLRHLLETLPA